MQGLKEAEVLSKSFSLSLHSKEDEDDGVEEAHHAWSAH